MPQWHLGSDHPTTTTAPCSSNPLRPHPACRTARRCGCSPWSLSRSPCSPSPRCWPPGNCAAPRARAPRPPDTHRHPETPVVGVVSRAENAMNPASEPSVDTAWNLRNQGRRPPMSGRLRLGLAQATNAREPTNNPPAEADAARRAKQPRLDRQPTGTPLPTDRRSAGSTTGCDPTGATSRCVLFTSRHSTVTPAANRTSGRGAARQPDVHPRQRTAAHPGHTRTETAR